MNEKLLELIRHLSEQDTKTLSQKALKVAEESGELAKVCLPYDNAPGTLHRFTETDAILEEVVDVMLSAISIAYDLNYNDDDINEMFMHKINKWASIQKSESLDTNKIPFEIHITVKDAHKDEFRAMCKRIEIKPIILHLQNNDGQIVFDDVMTSSVYIGNNTGALHEAERIAGILDVNHFEVVRKKIETVPWHPAAPTEDNGYIMPKDCYFESHLQVVCADTDDCDILMDIAKANNAHLSQNIYKVREDGSEIIMLTYRLYEGTVENFSTGLKRITDDLTSYDFEVGKVITEFSIFDTKVSHDESWLKGQDNDSNQ